MTNEKSPLVHCYNKGCGKLFDPSQNSDESKCATSPCRSFYDLNNQKKTLQTKGVCQHHPGNPVFHDALKGWSCCNKKSTDFTQFLSIPGCAKSAHSNVKPPEPEKPAPLDPETAKQEVFVSLETRKPPEAAQRPVDDEPLVEMKRTVATALLAALENAAANSSTAAATTDPTTTTTSGQVLAIGTTCKNATCQKVSISLNSKSFIQVKKNKNIFFFISTFQEVRGRAQ